VVFRPREDDDEKRRICSLTTRRHQWCRLAPGIDDHDEMGSQTLAASGPIAARRGGTAQGDEGARRGDGKLRCGKGQGSGCLLLYGEGRGGA
jgi:hypothetical protein